MIAAVADTHTIIWYLANDARLSMKAKATLDDAVRSGEQIAISAITLVEVVYLVEKGRVPAGRFTQLMAALDDPDSVLIEMAVTPAIARTLSRVDREQVPDMPDRIIAATALHLGIPVISRDGKIRTSEITTIW
jgi:PIN domain nuclease of toxin-antitoxin system